MVPICQSSYFVSGGTKGFDFIGCVDSREPQMHEIWCLISDSITREFHLTSQIDVGASTVRQCATQYSDENSRRILVIVQISINISIKLLGIPTNFWGCQLTFLDNVLAPTVPYG